MFKSLPASGLGIFIQPQFPHLKYTVTHTHTHTHTNTHPSTAIDVNYVLGGQLCPTLCHPIYCSPPVSSV